MDAICVLAELFWRKRYFDNTEIRQRFEFACDSFARGDVNWPRSPWRDRLERIGRLLIYRAALHLDTPTRILCSAAAPQATLRSFLRTHQIAAYLTAAGVFAESASGEVCMPRSFHSADRYFAMSLGAVTGHPADLVVTTATEGGRLSRSGLRLLLRDVFDELLLTLGYRASAADRHDVARFLLYVSGGRGWLVGANAVFLKHGRQDVPGRDAFDEIAMAEALMLAGDLVGARDRMMAGLARDTGCPLLLAAVVTSQVELARRSIDTESLSAARVLIERHRKRLGTDLCRYLGATVAGSEALIGADFVSARRWFLEAYGALPASAERAVELKKEAMISSVRAGYTQRVIESWSTQGVGGPRIWKVIRTLCVGPEWTTAASSLRTRASVCLDYLCGVLNAWATADHVDEELLALTLFLKGDVDAAFRPLGNDFLLLMARWAPRFYEKLRAAVITTVGDLGVAVPEVRALGASIRTIEEAWRDGYGADVDEQCNRVTDVA
jgi:hypothetical protein